MNDRQLHYFQAMGIDVYVRRDASPDVECAETAPVDNKDVVNSIGSPPAESERSVENPSPEMNASPRSPDEVPEHSTPDSASPANPGADSADLPPMFDEEPPPLDDYYAPSMGLEDPGPDPDAAPATSPEDPIASMTWERLRETVATCEKCELHGSRTQTVFGVGHPNARVMVIGEAPGRDEDLQGEPFVGRAGKLLDMMLKAAGFERKDVFIANILKCRPPNNRDPKAEEALACRAYLNRQIALIQPEVILSVGRVSAQNLLDSEDNIGRMRGRPHRIPGRNTPVHVTYHPAYLLRQPSEKRKVWTDLQQMLDTLDSTADHADL